MYDNLNVFSYKNSKQNKLYTIPVNITIKTAFTTPAWPTIQPDLRNTITPKMFIRHDVNTPSQVPNSTGWDKKKLDFHHGTSPCKLMILV